MWCLFPFCQRESDLLAGRYWKTANKWRCPIQRSHAFFFVKKKKKDIREKKSNCSRDKRGLGTKTVFLRQIVFTRVINIILVFEWRRDADKCGHVPISPAPNEGTVCLCLHVCVDVQSRCNLVWQVTVMLSPSTTPQQCLNYTFWKGFLGISFALWPYSMILVLDSLTDLQ